MQLLQQQLLLYGKIGRANPGDPLRRLTFCGSNVQLVSDKIIRKVGRPRNEWAKMLGAEALKLCNGRDMASLLNNRVEWAHAVKQHCTVST